MPDIIPTLSSWIPAISTTSLLALALWLARHLFITRLTHTVAHEFNTKLEALRSQLRESEERLKADLRSKEAEIEALRGGAMTAMASRQMAIDKRRLEAVDQLWSAVISLAQTKPIAAMLAVVNFDEAAKRAERDPKVRSFFETMPAGGFDATKIDLSGASKARPFVTPVAWATYLALSAIAMHSVLKLQILRSGIAPKGLIDDDIANQVIKAALPQYRDFIDQYGAHGYHMVLDALENKLLQDLHAMLGGVEADKVAVEQAAEIVRLANELSKKETKASATPPLADGPETAD